MIGLSQYSRVIGAPGPGPEAGRDQHPQVGEVTRCKYGNGWSLCIFEVRGKSLRGLLAHVLGIGSLYSCYKLISPWGVLVYWGYWLLDYIEG